MRSFLYVLYHARMYESMRAETRIDGFGSRRDALRNLSWGKTGARWCMRIAAALCLPNLIDSYNPDQSAAGLEKKDTIQGIGRGGRTFRI